MTETSVDMKREDKPCQLFCCIEMLWELVTFICQAINERQALPTLWPIDWHISKIFTCTCYIKQWCRLHETKHKALGSGVMVTHDCQCDEI